MSAAERQRTELWRATAERAFNDDLPDGDAITSLADALRGLADGELLEARAKVRREVAEALLRDLDEMDEQTAAGAWMTMVHGGDTDKGGDWDEAFAMARSTSKSRPKDDCREWLLP